MSIAMDRVAYKPLGMSPAKCDDDADADELDDAECDHADLEDNNGQFGAPSRPSHYPNRLGRDHQGLLSSYKHLGSRQLRTLLYLLAAILFLLFIAQLSTNTTSRQRRLQSLSSATPMSLSSASAAASSASQPAAVAAPPATGGNLPPSQHHQDQLVDPLRPLQQQPQPQKQRQANALIGAPTPHDDDGSSSNSSTSTSTSTAAAVSYPRLPDKRPQYDSYLSSVLHEHNSPGGQDAASRLDSLDDLHFPIQDHQYRPPTASSIWWLLNLRGTNNYVTVTNYIRAMKSFSYNASITLTTQASTEFMHHTLELCKRWDGPISVSVFCPGNEMLVATTLIKFMRQCLPGPLSACIKDKVTWHLVYNKLHGPSPSAISYPKFHLDSRNYPLFVDQDQCPKLAGPEPSDLIKQFEEQLRRSNGMSSKTFRQQFQLTYPINVLRNTARLAATTKYVLASDIELYPSINLVPSFTNFINKHDIRKEYSYIEKFDFTLPIFEVKANVTPPKTKRELIKLVQQGDAIFFHKWVCDACQNFPNRLDWLQTDKYGQEDYKAGDHEIAIFEVTQRDRAKNSWEPIFIGTNDDPLYDDRLTWDGRRDKMAQMYEMCLQDYYLLVLGNAFLVHAPGIKHIDRNDNMKRYKYIRENNAIYDATMLKLKEQYSGSRNINKC